MKVLSKINWNKLQAVSDQDTDTSDIPEFDDSFFIYVELHTPVKKPVTIRLGADGLKVREKATRRVLINYSARIWKLITSG